MNATANVSVPLDDVLEHLGQNTKQELPSLIGNRDQIIKYVKEYEIDVPKESPSPADEFHDIFYAKNIFQETTKITFVDWMSCLYLGGAVADFWYTLVYDNPAKGMKNNFNTWISNFDNAETQIAFYANGIKLEDASEAYYNKMRQPTQAEKDFAQLKHNAEVSGYLDIIDKNEYERDLREQYRQSWP